MAEIGTRIRSLRKDAGLSIRDLARKVDVSHSSISQWEAGKTQPKLIHIPALAGALGVAEEDVLGAALPNLRVNDAKRATDALTYFHDQGEPPELAKMTVEEVHERFLHRDRENGVYPIDRPTRLMPVIGFAHAGAPTISDEMVEEQFPVREVDWHRTARLTRIIGDCMSPTLIEGDYAGIAICDPKELRPYHDIVVVVLDTDETVCRWWGGRDAGAGARGPWVWTLVPGNVPEYPVLNVRERDSRLVGRVAWSHREW